MGIGGRAQGSGRRRPFYAAPSACPPDHERCPGAGNWHAGLRSPRCTSDLVGARSGAPGPPLARPSSSSSRSRRGCSGGEGLRSPSTPPGRPLRSGTFQLDRVRGRPGTPSRPGGLDDRHRGTIGPPGRRQQQRQPHLRREQAPVHVPRLGESNGRRPGSERVRRALRPRTGRHNADRHGRRDIRLGDRERAPVLRRVRDVPRGRRLGAEFTTTAAGGAPEKVRYTFEVATSTPVVRVGDPAPASDTPTAASVER